MSVQTNYAELKSQLDEVIQKIQSEDITIDEAVQAYEDGMKLVKDLEAYLTSAENKIKKLQKKNKDT